MPFTLDSVQHNVVIVSLQEQQKMFYFYLKRLLLLTRGAVNRTTQN